MEQKDNLIQSLTYAFALKSIELYRFLSEEKKEFILSKQFLRSATSIGANVEEAIGWQSKKDFIAKLSISQKEARETYYWIKLLKDSKYVDASIFQEREQELLSILKILTKIITTSKQSIHNQ